MQMKNKLRTKSKYKTLKIMLIDNVSHRGTVLIVLKRLFLSLSRILCLQLLFKENKDEDRFLYMTNIDKNYIWDSSRAN